MSIVRALTLFLIAAAMPLHARPIGVIERWQPAESVPRSESIMKSMTLAAHNRVRSAAGVGPISWDADLAKDASAWASSLAHDGRFEHAPRLSGQPVEGENLWMGTRGAYGYAEMTDAWIDENRYFTAGRFPSVSNSGSWHDVGHYTQMVWADSTRVGCALAANESDEYFVCRYSPAGNVIGRDPLAP